MSPSTVKHSILARPPSCRRHLVRKSVQNHRVFCGIWARDPVFRRGETRAGVTKYGKTQYLSAAA